MQNGQSRNGINTAVQHSPTRHTHLFDGPVGRCCGQQAQQHSRYKTHSNERPLDDIDPNVIPRQPHVKQAVAHGMQKCVKKSQQAQTAPKQKPLRHFQGHTQWRDQQRDAQKSQGPFACGAN